MRWFRWCGLGVVAAVLVLAAAPVQARTWQEPGSPRAEKQAARAALVALAGDKRLEKALAAVDESLTAAWWASDSTLDSKLGDEVFKAERKAVDELLKLKDPPAGAADVVAALVAVDRQLAETALAAAAGGDAKKLAKAQEAFEAALAEGDPGKAIAGFGGAWGEAVAAAPAGGPQTFTLKTCDLADVVAAIDAANATTDPDTIVLKAGCTYVAMGPAGYGEGGLSIVRNPLTILGNGATITRDPSAAPGSLLQATGWTAAGGLIVDDVTFSGGRGSIGAGLFVMPGFDVGAPAPAVTVTNSRFVDNATIESAAPDPGGVGGAISIQGMPGTTGNPVTLQNDVFTSNSTHGGPVVDPNSWDQRAGGAVHLGAFLGPVQISGCTFTSNRTGDAPEGADPWSSSYSQGGAVWSASSLTVTDSTFTGNETGAVGSGGAIYLTAAPTPATLTLARDTFSENAADLDGGAVRVAAFGMVATFTDSGSTYTGNSAGRRGGAVLVEGANATFSDDRFEGNGPGLGGAINVGGNGASLTVASTMFTSNTGNGGAVYAQTEGAGTTTISGSTFTGNADVSPEGGGGALTGTGTILIEGSGFTGNTGRQAGALWFWSFGQYVGHVTVRDSTFTQNVGLPNSSPFAGSGAINSDGPGSTLTLERVTFDANVSQGGFGGAVNAGATTLSVVDSRFTGNGTTHQCFGAAIAARTDVGIVRSTFAGNTEPGGCGTIGWWSSTDRVHTLTVTDSTFTGNSGGINGQTCGNDPGTACGDSIVVRGSTFSANTGGAIAVNMYPYDPPRSDRGSVEIVNTTLSGNLPLPGGLAYGGLQVGYATARVVNSTITGNVGMVGTGLTASSGAVLTAVNSIVADNTGDESWPGHQRDCTAMFGGTIVDGGGNLTTPVSWGCPATFAVGDPLLAPLADNGGPTPTLALLVGSAAIDAGVDSLCPAADQRGVARPQGAHCDIGSFELEP